MKQDAKKPPFFRRLLEDNSSFALNFRGSSIFCSIFLLFRVEVSEKGKTRKPLIYKGLRVELVM